MRQVIRNELNADAADHTAWMYRETKTGSGKKLVLLTVDTSRGTVSETIEKDGRPPSSQEHQADLNRLDRMINSPSARHKAQASTQHDDQQAREFASMLPDAFLWQIVADHNGETSLSFRANPQFRPPNMKAKAMAAVSGIMIVDKQQMRLKRISGRLDHSINFGWGLLGKLEAGGTCDVSRAEVAPGEWRISELHIHISGKALIFDTIGFQEDDVIDSFHPALSPIDLKQAAEMLEAEVVARALHVQLPRGQ